LLLAMRSIVQSKSGEGGSTRWDRKPSPGARDDASHRPGRADLSQGRGDSRCRTSSAHLVELL